MSEEVPFSREEALKYEAQNYLRRLQRKLAQFQSDKERFKEVLHQREQGAQRQAQSYLGNLSERAEFRASARARGEEEKKMMAELLRKQAEAYRQRLRGYLRPGQIDESEEEQASPDQQDHPSP
ncbi:MAG TPA: hypothetical protein V6D08_10690 [Candidatus Obscuribacterales bacterium]